MNSPLLSLLEAIHNRAKDRGGVSAIDAVRAVVNSPVTAAIVAVSPTPFDDVILSFARLLLPPVQAPASA